MKDNLVRLNDSELDFIEFLRNISNIDCDLLMTVIDDSINKLNREIELLSDDVDLLHANKHLDYKKKLYVNFNDKLNNLTFKY